MAKTGRPIKLSKDITEEICRYLKVGNYVETAIAIVGVSKSTFYDWLKRGNDLADQLEQNPKLKLSKEDVLFLDFSDAIKKSIAQSEARDVMIISKAAETQWQASAWRLERKNWENWGRKDRINADIDYRGEVKSDNTHTFSISKELLKDAEGRELIKALWKKQQELNTDDVT